jgi:hypothetical protein
LNSSVIDPGFATDHVLLLPISPDQAGVRVQKPPGFDLDLVTRVAALPGVQAVTAMDPVPLWFGRNAAFYSMDDGAVQVRLNYARIAPGYFDTLRIRLLRGRDFTQFDTATSPPVAIVNETMARRYWPNRAWVFRHLAYPAAPRAGLHTVRHRDLAAGRHRQRNDGAAVLAEWQRRGRDHSPAPVRDPGCRRRAGRQIRHPR